MSFYQLPPLNGPLVNTYGVQSGSLNDGRIMDRYGYDTGLRINSDWTVSDRYNYRTGIQLDPQTGRFLP